MLLMGRSARSHDATIFDAEWEGWAYGVSRFGPRAGDSLSLEPWCDAS